MPNIGFPELMIVLVIALIVLGPKRLPEAGKSLGRGMREFKDSLAGITGGDDDDDDYSDNGLPAPSKAEEPKVTAASTTSSAASTESEQS
jgi:sec-independent protein translocase protein TatA